MTSRTIFVVPDLQVPFHDKGFVDAMAQCIADHKQLNDSVLTIGDEMDMQTISRWAHGTPLEYEKSIGRDRDLTVQVLKDLQVTDCIRSNHTDRLFTSVMMRLPGLMGLPELELENFLRLPENGITLHRHGWAFHPNWIALHGDESGSSQVAGQTAAGLCKKTGLNVICGHTHRLGMQPHTTSAGGKITRTLFGIEVGNAMRLEEAKYTKGIANWQQGWAAMLIDGKNVHPLLIPVINRSFTYLGSVYSW